MKLHFFLLRSNLVQIFPKVIWNFNVVLLWDNYPKYHLLYSFTKGGSSADHEFTYSYCSFNSFANRWMRKIYCLGSHYDTPSIPSRKILIFIFFPPVMIQALDNNQWMRPLQLSLILWLLVSNKKDSFYRSVLGSHKHFTFFYLHTFFCKFETLK